MADDEPDPGDTPHCQLSLRQVDTLIAHAHRIVLYGNLLAGGIEEDFEPAKNLYAEALLELVGDVLADAAAIKVIVSQSHDVARAAWLAAEGSR